MNVTCNIPISHDIVRFSVKSRSEYRVLNLRAPLNGTIERTRDIGPPRGGLWKIIKKNKSSLH